MPLIFRNPICLFVLLLSTSISVFANEAEDAVLTLVVEVPFIELHSGPALGYPVLYVIEKGETVKVQLKRTNWLKITDKRGNVGWLSQDELLGLTHNGQTLNEADYSDEYFFKRDIEAGVLYGDFEGANFYNLYAGYAFTDVFSAEISAGKALGNISDSDIYELMWVSQLVPDYFIIPYLGVGGGIINTKPHSVLADAKNRQDPLMSAAFGVKYHLARNFLLRAEYKYSLVLTDRNDNEEIKVWKLGFSIFF
jgi:hypothetical protein